MTNTVETTATVSETPAAENGAVLFVPLNKLKKSLSIGSEYCPLIGVQD